MLIAIDLLNSWITTQIKQAFNNAITIKEDTLMQTNKLLKRASQQGIIYLGESHIAHNNQLVIYSIYNTVLLAVAVSYFHAPL